MEDEYTSRLHSVALSDSESNESYESKKISDDTKIAQIIESLEDSVALQATLDKLGAWAERSGMQFNTAKCQVMHIGKNNPKNMYMMNGLQLSKTKIKNLSALTFLACNLSMLYRLGTRSLWRLRRRGTLE